MNVARFRSVYQDSELYDRLLPPHLFAGVQDADLIAALMRKHYGEPGRSLCVLELGCGTGRVTSRLIPYADRLTAVDSSRGMLAAVKDRFPQTSTWHAHITQAVRAMVTEHDTGGFDMVGAFFSLSYPLGDFFEEMTAEAIRPCPDLNLARAEAAGLVRDILRLLAPGGHLLVLYFDSDAPEQRLVTRLWERIAPFPPGGRAYTRHVLLGALLDAERAGLGWLSHTRLGGVCALPHPEAALDWITRVHLKDFPALVEDADVRAEVSAYVAAHTAANGQVLSPTGVHVIDFHAEPGPACQVPGGRRP